ncbi:MAG: hypothetical protein ABIR71_09325 [Chthoniobacterales bacterium]
MDGADRSLIVGFVLRASGPTALEEHFAAMDIGWAQELLGRRGKLSAIQLQLTNSRESEVVTASLRALVPPDATIATPTA